MSNASGASASRPNASSGPSSAPTVSSARCTPNDVPRSSSREESEIIASRGAVRRPLPERSIITIALIAPNVVPTAASASLQTADRPYPIEATPLCRPRRSPMKPPARRTIAAAPWYRPSMTPNCNGVRRTTVTRNSGRMAETISEEMSVSRLQIPSSTTVRLTRGWMRREASARWARSRAPELSTRYMHWPRPHESELRGS